MQEIMNNFWKNNIVAIIGLFLTIGGLLIHVGFTKATIEANQSELSDFKKDTNDKIKEIESLSRTNNEKVNDKLDTLNRQMAVVVSWIEEQKRNNTR